MQHERKGLQGQTWIHGIVEVAMGSGIHRGDNAHLAHVIGEDHQRGRWM